MKKRTRIIAWIFLSITGCAFCAAIYIFGIAHVFARLPLRLIVDMLLWGLQWPFWLYLLRRKAWAWSTLVAVYSLLFARWLYHMGWRMVHGTAYQGTHVSPILNLVVSAYALIIVILPLWALLTDRPNGWARNTENPIYNHNKPLI